MIAQKKFLWWLLFIISNLFYKKGVLKFSLLTDLEKNPGAFTSNPIRFPWLISVIKDKGWEETQNSLVLFGSHTFNFFHTCCITPVALLNIVNISVNATAKKIGNMNLQRIFSNWSTFIKKIFFTIEMNLSADIPNNDHILENSLKITPIAKQ